MKEEAVGSRLIKENVYIALDTRTIWAMLKLIRLSFFVTNLLGDMVPPVIEG
jgi:hypothetical protein